MKLSRLTCLLSLACVLVFSQTALADESAPTFNWTGPYAGLHFGYGFGRDDVTNVSPLPTPAIFDMAPAQVIFNTGGLVGGAQVGYNYQTGSFVVGIEADFSGSGISGSQNVSPIPGIPGGVLTAQENINWYGTLRPRLGYTVKPTVLIYATGGLAYGNVSYMANTNFIPGHVGTEQYPASLSTTAVGWALGGGIEYALYKNWTIKAEFMYMNLGSESVTANPTIPFPEDSPKYQIRYDWQTTASIFQIGVNYKF